MKENGKTLEYKEKKYRLEFNLNVMERIQEEYGTLDKWGELTDGTGHGIFDEDGNFKKGEPDVKAVIFGFTEMLNEGIDIENEENGTEIRPLTLKQVGRMITAIGLDAATQKMNQTVIDSTKNDEKNA